MQGAHCFSTACDPDLISVSWHKAGREKDLVSSLFRKAQALRATNQALSIISAFFRDSLKGYIYVEARQESDVRHAIRGLVGIYLNNELLMVPLEQMPDLLKTKKKETPIVLGGWVRIKRGKYAGDLAQVNELMENADEVGLKFVPRIDLNPKEADMHVGADGKKRKKGGGAFSGGIAFRPQPRMFNPEEVRKAYKAKDVTRAKGGFMFQGDYFRNGYIEKDIRITGIEVEDVNPTIDEITRFLGDGDADASRDVDLAKIAEATKKVASILQPGDHVEIFEGDQKGIQGTVHSMAGEVVIILPSDLFHPELKGQQIEAPSRSVRKAFKPGDHVKVMTGQNVDESGLVIRVRDDIVTFLSDLTLKEVEVFSRDLRVAAEVGSSTNTFGQFELHDIVQLECAATHILQTVVVDPETIVQLPNDRRDFQDRARDLPRH